MVVTASPETWASVRERAIAHLRVADPIVDGVIQQVGPCWLEPGGEIFAAVVSAIVGQQISTRAARTIRKRLEEALGGSPTPERVIALGRDGIRAAGLSGVKSRYVEGFAQRVANGEIRLDHLAQADDDEVVAELTQAKGVGRWTAEMVLIFCLGRLDVLPVDDLGFRVGIRNQYRFESIPAKAQLETIAEPWRPYRSIATWYLWRSLDGLVELF